MSALRDAVFLLTPGRSQPYGARTHQQQWQLDRARFIWQHGPRRLRSAARAELADMNAIRRLYASEGKKDYEGEIPLAALREPVGDLTRLNGGPLS